LSLRGIKSKSKGTGKLHLGEVSRKKKKSSLPLDGNQSLRFKPEGEENTEVKERVIKVEGGRS